MIFWLLKWAFYTTIYALNTTDLGVGAGGGSMEKYGNWIKDSGAGGDGVVIIYGIPA